MSEKPADTIGCDLVCSLGLLGPLTGQPRRSRSLISDRDHVEEVEMTPTEGIAHRTSLFP